MHLRLYAYIEDETKNYTAITYLNKITRLLKVRRTNNYIVHMADGFVTESSIKKCDGLLWRRDNGPSHAGACVP